MIAEKHLPSKTFRLVLAPSIVNPRVNRLWLIPSGRTAVMSSDFVPIVSEMQAVYAEMSAAKQRASVVGFTGKEAARLASDISPSFMGMAHLEYGDRVELTRLVFYVPEPYFSKVTSVITRAGIAIPNRIREAIYRSAAATPFAWWMAAVAHFSKIPPICVDITSQGADSPGFFANYAKGERVKMGWIWPDLFAASLSAIEAAGLVGPDLTNAHHAAGDWSDFMSKAEFARRVIQNPKARLRQVEALFEKLEKQKQEGKSKWAFRLDTLDESLRKKLEAPRS